MVRMGLAKSILQNMLPDLCCVNRRQSMAMQLNERLKNVPEIAD